MLMENTHYLPDEKLTLQNYPEVGTCWADVQKIQTYALSVQSAMIAYNAGQADRVDVNADELRSYIDLSRSVCEILGNAPKVCFEVLMELRSTQYVLQEILFAQRSFGSMYVGTPTPIVKGSDT